MNRAGFDQFTRIGFPQRALLEIIDGGVIVDGRSRYLAAKQLGIKRVPVIRAPLNGDDPVL